MGTLSIGVGALVVAALLSAVVVRSRAQMGWQIMAGIVLALVVWQVAEARGAFEDRESCSDCGWGAVYGVILFLGNVVGWTLGTALGGSLGIAFKANRSVSEASSSSREGPER